MRKSATLLAVLVSATACSSELDCDLGDRIDIPSPDGSKTAWVYALVCEPGSTSTWNVSILEVDEAVRAAPGNVLRTAREQSVLVRWLERSTLKVEVDELDSVDYEPVVDGIRIDLRASPGTPYN